MVVSVRKNIRDYISKDNEEYASNKSTQEVYGKFGNLQMVTGMSMWKLLV